MELSELLGDSYKEGMTIEEVSEALKGIEMPRGQDAEIERLKSAISKSNSEAADWKRKYTETLDDTKKKAVEDDEKTKALQDEVARLRKEMTISGYKASYVSMGYSDADATKVAEMLADGKIEDAMAIQKKHQEKMAEQIKKDLLKNTHRPDGSPDDNDGEDEAVKMARDMATARAENSKRASEGMKNYLR